MPTKKTVVLYLTAVFVAGFLAGGVAGFCFGNRRFLAPPRPEEMVAHICALLKSKLHLTPEQEKEIRPIVTETAAELESIHSTTGSQVSAAFQRSNLRMAQFLSPEQKILLEQMDRERRTFFPPPRGPHPGPPPH
jgi:Spy/CpxP family protein refolding chaperone